MKKLLLSLTLLFSVSFSFAQIHAGWNKSVIDVVKGSGVFNEPCMIYVDSTYFIPFYANKKYAAIYYFHGDGDAGTDTISILNSGLPYNLNHGEKPYAILPNGDTLRYIVFAPQRGSYSPDPVWFGGMFEDANKRFRLDSTRQYLNGYSAGGWGTLGIPVNNTDTTYTGYVSAIWCSSAAMQDLVVANEHIIADRKIPLILDAGDQSSDVNYYDAQKNLVVNVLKPLYNGADTIVQRGYGHDHFPDRVSVNKRYSKLGNKNIYEWYAQFQNRYVSVAPPNPNACNTAAPKKVTLSLTAANEIYLPNGTRELSNIKGKDTVLIPALPAGARYVDIVLGGFGGDSCNPVIIMNSGGQVLANYIRIQGDAKYFKILGNGVAGLQYGFKLGTPGASAGLGIGIAHDYEVAYIATGYGADNGFQFKKNPDATDSITLYPNYLIKNVLIHDNLVDSARGEGMYIGHTYPYADPYNGNLIPIRMSHVWIYNNIVTNSWWDGIQLSNATGNCKIYNNYVYNYGTVDAGSQRAGIILGANTSGDVYGNTVIKGTGNAIQIFAYGNVNVYNNLIDSAGLTQEINGPGSTRIGEQDFFSNDDSNRVEGIRPPLRLSIHDNTIKHHVVNKVLYSIVDNNQSDSLYFQFNNICMTSDTTNWTVNAFAIGQSKKVFLSNTLSTTCGTIAPPPPPPPGWVRKIIHFFIRKNGKRNL
jgi:hypothetical protein